LSQLVVLLALLLGLPRRRPRVQSLSSNSVPVSVVVALDFPRLVGVSRGVELAVRLDLLVGDAPAEVALVGHPPRAGIQPPVMRGFPLRQARSIDHSFAVAVQHGGPVKELHGSSPARVLRRLRGLRHALGDRTLQNGNRLSVIIHLRDSKCSGGQLGLGMLQAAAVIKHAAAHLPQASVCNLLAVLPEAKLLGVSNGATLLSGVRPDRPAEEGAVGVGKPR